jgi:hypothetical protein
VEGLLQWYAEGVRQGRQLPDQSFHRELGQCMVLLYKRSDVVGVHLQLTANGFDLTCHIYDWLIG